jgi:FAD/FMN-containing dehydrogenase
LELTRDVEVRRAYSKDASGLVMLPEAVVRAGDAQDVVEVVAEALRLDSSVTPAGSQTSMTGASITDRGILLSMSGLNRIIDIDPEKRSARVEPGITIGALNRDLRETGLQFAPDPTSENDATVGGAIACNASGARSLRHGATRRHIRALTVVGGDAAVVAHRRHALEKDTVGFGPVQDTVDWYVGAEGTLGIVVEAELALVALPENLIGLAIPFPDDAAALRFVVAARNHASRSPQCLEYFDREAMAIAGLAAQRPWPDDARAMIYLEDDAGEAVDDCLDSWLAVAESSGAVAGDIRAFDTASALREARAFRHAVPATMNERGAAFHSSGGRKVSTDWSVPYTRLAEFLDISRRASEKSGAPPAVTYGHAGNGHPHQNFIAEDAEALERIRASIDETLTAVFAAGGTFSAEHGVGKLKKTWVERQLSGDQLAMMRAMKSALDPRGVFSPGNIL